MKSWYCLGIATVLAFVTVGCLQVTSYADADTAQSYVLLTPENIPADGNTAARVAIVLRRKNGDALSGVRVALQADNGQVIQPTAPTDSLGTAVGSIVAPVPGEHTVSAQLLLDHGDLALTANALINAYKPAAPGSAAALSGTLLNLVAYRTGADGQVDTSYTGLVGLVSSDTAATLPAAHAYDGGDGGLHVFRNISLVTPGTQTVSAVDATTAEVLRTVSIAVVALPANPATRLSLTLDSQANAGATIHAQVVAKDADDNSTAAFAAKVHFTSSDPNATLPADYTFTEADHGEHTFTGLSLIRAGQQSVSVQTPALPATSQNILIAPGLPRYLGFIGEPVSNTSACQPFNPNVQVQEYDIYGNIAPNFGDTVDLMLDGPQTAASLLGPQQVRTIDGVASFGNLAVNRQGTNYVLYATIGWEPVPSATFSIGADIPQVASLGPIPGASGNVGVPYIIRDGCGTQANLAFSFDPNMSGNFTPTTGAPSDANAQGVTQVPTSQAGAAGTYLWDSIHDLGHVNASQVRVRLVATANGVSSPPVISTPFSVHNGMALSSSANANVPAPQTCVALAQVNGDARLDMLTCGANANTVTVSFGDGQGNMVPVQTLSTTTLPLAVFPAHIDGDAHIDFVAAQNGNSMQIYWGAGDGTFTMGPQVPLGTQPQGVALADMNHDGLRDIISANVDGTLSVALATSRTTFATPTPHHVGSRLTSLTTADMNHDGHPDIISTDADADALILSFGDGGGSFGSSTRYNLATGAHPTAVAVADINHDGSTDAVVTTQATAGVSVWLGNNAGALTGGVAYGTAAAPTGVVIADFDVNGALDVAVTHGAGVSLLAGDGAGHLATASTFTAGTQPSALAVGDINRDGTPDVVTANGAGGGGVWISTNALRLPHNAHWSAPSIFKFQIAGSFATYNLDEGDLNGDGKPDVAITLPDVPGIGIMLGDGAGGLSQGYQVAITTPSPQGIIVSDLNNDGHADVVTSSSTTNALVVSLGPVTFLPGEIALFSSTKLLAVQTGPTNVVSRDLNGDGWVDLVVPNTTSGTLSVLMNTGNGTFAQQIVSATGASPYWVALGDINGDQVQDAVVALYNSSNLALLEGDGGGNFTLLRTLTSRAHPHHVAVADINADGFLDIAAATSAAIVDVYLGDGGGNFVLQAAVTSHGSATVVAGWRQAGNGQAPDLVVVNNQAPYQLEIHPNLGHGTFGAPTLSVTDYFPGGMVLGDLNGDGQDDIMTSAASNTVSGLFSDGHGGLQLTQPSATTTEAGNTNTHIALGDINWDGMTDVVEATSTGISLKLGQAGGTFGPLSPMFVAQVGPHNNVRLVDMNNDGWLDIVATGSGGTYVAINNRTGGFSTPTPAGPIGVTQSAACDFDGDGNQDALIAAGSKLQLMLGDGTGGLTASTFWNTSATASVISLGDFNGDGADDAMLSVGTGLQLFLRQGNDMVGQSVLSSTCNLGCNDTGDLNRDGHLDVVANCVTGAGGMNVWLGNGDGTFGAVTPFLAAGGSDTRTVMTDVTGDAIPDVVYSLSHGKGLAMWVGDGAGGLGIMNYLGADIAAAEALINDFNFDGLADIYGVCTDWAVFFGRP